MIKDREKDNLANLFPSTFNKKNRQKIDGFQIFISEYNYFLSSSKNSS